MTLNSHGMFHVFNPENVDFTDNVGHILTTNDSGVNTQGTGFFLTNFHMITAAHNVFAPNSVVVSGSVVPRYDLISATIAPGAYAQTPTGSAVLPSGHSVLPFLQANPNLDIINPLGYAEDGSGNGDFGDDMTVIPLTQDATAAGAELSSLVIFANPNDAITMTSQVTVLGYPANRSGTGDGNNGALHIAFGNNIAVNDISNASESPEYVYRFNEIDTDQGVSGAPYYFYVDVTGDGGWSQGDGDIVGVAGVHVNETEVNGAWEAQASAFTVEHYNLIAASVLVSAPGTFNADMAARQYVIADQVNGGTLNGTFFHENIYGGAGDDIISSFGGNDIIFASVGNDQIDGGINGNDTVDYRGIGGTVTATLNGSTVTVVKTAGGTDTLTDIEAIHGTNHPTSGDTFIVAAFSPGRPVFINGHSPTGTPQEVNNGALYNDGVGGPEDCIIIDSALLAAGAAVTYLSNDGEGMIYLGDERVSYTGIFHVPAQDPADYFWGTSGIQEDEGWVGVTDTGGILVDLSGVTQPITDTLLAGVSLWNLVDEIAVGDNDVALDLGAIGVSAYTGGAGIDDIVGGATDDIFSGNGGDDILDGGAGADTVFGNGGDDILRGGDGDDMLVGGDGDDVIYGGAGDDVLGGGLGADAFRGDGGTDTVDYSGAASKVRAEMLNPATNFGEAAGDTYVSIENIIGSNFDVSLSVGQSPNNRSCESIIERDVVKTKSDFSATTTVQDTVFDFAVAANDSEILIATVA